MIVDVLIQAVVEVLTWVVGFLPSSPAPPDLSGIVSAFVASVSPWFGIADTWIDLGTFTGALGLMVVWHGVVGSFRLLVYVFALLHIGGTT